MRKRIIFFALLSLILQLLYFISVFYELLDSNTRKNLFLFLTLYYPITLFYLIRQCIIKRKVIFDKNKIVTSICIFFSFPFLIISLFIYGVFFEKYYVVSLFNLHCKSYKEVKWYYKTGEVYSVEYWYSKKYRSIKNMDDIYDFSDTSKLNSFTKFSDEKVSRKDFIKDSTWYKFEKNGDTIWKAVYKDNELIE